VRLIGHLENERRARTFGDYLYVNGIENQVDPAENGTWEIWVRADDQIEQAESLLGRFRDSPDDPLFEGAADAATAKRDKEQKALRRFQKKIIDKDALFPARPRMGFVTILLMAASVLLTIFSELGTNDQFLQPFFITQFEAEAGQIRWMPGLPEIRHGEIWRLLTPIFIHFGLWHILFNMLWLKDLGSMIENRKGSLYLSGIVIATAVLSNLAQYRFGGQPRFGGMSGVVYALLAFIWIRGKYDPSSGLRLHRYVVIMMMVWFVLCLVGIIPNVANAAHAVGLLLGMAWGFISAKLAFRA
jgi:GlpG protein